MRRTLQFLFLAAWGAGFVRPAQAQVVIDPSQAVAPARTTPGTGLCGTAIHRNTGVYNFPEEAITYLDKISDSTIDGRSSRLFTTLNLRNSDPNALGDFTAAKWPDEYFPYSATPLASPQGDDLRIALRVRGYFNVPATLAGKTIAFGLNCDDVCQLKIGSNKIVLDPIANDDAQTSRIIYPIKFTSPGLYPVELVYFQNGAAGYAEWARTDVEVQECGRDVMGKITGCRLSLSDPTYGDKFKLIDKTELYSSIVGVNTSCQECGAPGQNCTPGSYCGDGLCQACEVPDHCGPSCTKCPGDARICSSGRCVQCTADDQCPAGQTCDIPNAKCTTPTPCRNQEDCPPGKICDPDEQICKAPPTPCSDPSMCPAGQQCIGNRCLDSRTYPRLQLNGCSASSGQPIGGSSEQLASTLGLLASILLGAALLRSRLRQTS